MDKKSNIKNFIKESAEKSRKSLGEYPFGGGYAFVKDALPESVNIESVLSAVENLVPSHLMVGVDTILVGEFDELKSRNVNALLKDGAIYVSNDQDDEDDMVDDIIHEIAHSVEEENAYDLYAKDQHLSIEFTNKRSTFERFLNDVGIDTSDYNFKEIEYDVDFDKFLYKKVGYDTIETLVNGLFPNAYSPTSIREYFASGFEEYFLGDRNYLKKVSPVLYRKIKEVIKND